MPEAASSEEDDVGGSDAGPTSQSGVLVDIALSGYEFGQSLERELYYVDRERPAFAQRLNGPALRAELARRYYQAVGRPPNASALNDAIAVLAGTAAYSATVAVSRRVAQVGSRVYLDLGDADGHVVIVSKRRWWVTTVVPVLFWRSELTGPLPVPTAGVGADRAIGLLGQFLNMTEGDLALCVAWLVSTLQPGIEHPILLIQGVQGTGKTTAERHLKSAVDPSPAPTWTAPARAEDWVVAASNAYVIPLDNISSIPPWLSDALCQACTGGAWVARRRYSDKEVSVVSFKRAVIIDGIDAGSLRGDLADRAVPIELQEIPARRRRRESALTRRYQQAHPDLLGSLLDLLVEVIRERRNVRLVEYPRMADFAKTAAAVDRVLGTAALDTYMGSRASLARVVVEGDRVGSALKRYMERGATDNPLEITAQGLLMRISPANPDQYWPATPRGLVAALKRVVPALREVGIEVSFARRSGGSRTRVITIERMYEL